MVPPPPGSPSRSAKTDASPLSQALAFGAFAVAFAALGIRTGDPVSFVAPALALTFGIAISIGTGIRRFFAAFPGLAVAVLAMVAATIGWGVAESRGWSLSYGFVALVGLVVLGCDWAWVERLRPLVVASGLGVAVLLDEDLGTALVVAVAWFGVAAGALWSLQRDIRRSLPTPAPVGGGRHRVDPSGQELALIAGASIALGLLVTLLVSMIHLELDPPNASSNAPGRSLPSTNGGSGGGRTDPGSGSGSGSASGSGSGSRSGPGSGSGSGDGSGGGTFGGVQDRNGDGVIDARDGLAVLDRNGDGIIDDRDSTDPVDVNGDGVLDGDDGIVFLDANDDGVIDRRDGGVTTGGPRPNDRNGDGIIDRNDVPILSDTNDDGVIDRRNVVIVSDLDGSGSIDAGDVSQAADRNGDGVVDSRDDLEIVDANGDGAVDDDELLAALDRNGDGTIDRNEALALDRDGDGRLDPAEIGQLPLSGTLGQELEEQRRQMATEDLTRTLLITLGLLVLGAAVVAALVALHRRLVRHRDRADRAWAVVLVERLEAEGAERGRRRRRDEPISHYAAALGDDVLRDPRLAGVGLVVTAALFAPVPPDDASRDWAGQVLDEAVAAHPLPTRADRRRERRNEARREKADENEVAAGATRGS